MVVKRLSEALNRYREQERAGADMVKAGEDLADVVERIVLPPPCAPPREEWLRRRDSFDLDEPGVPIADLE